MKKIIKKNIPEFVLTRYQNYKKKKLVNSYIGDNVFCPLCNSRFKRFAPFGLVKRENAKCHTCGSLERHRLLWRYLNEKTNLFKTNTKIRLLHFAPEKTFYDIFSKNQTLDYFPCDLMPERYKYKGNVKILKADITDIPFEENYFDVILCNHVLEHVEDDRKAISELYRVMDKGAWGIFQVPIDYDRKETYEDLTITSPEERERIFGQSDHVRCYGRDYEERLKSVGFKVIEDKYVENLAADELFRFGLLPSEFIYFCQK